MCWSLACSVVDARSLRGPLTCPCSNAGCWQAAETTPQTSGQRDTSLQHTRDLLSEQQNSEWGGFEPSRPKARTARVAPERPIRNNVIPGRQGTRYRGMERPGSAPPQLFIRERDRGAALAKEGRWRGRPPSLFFLTYMFVYDCYGSLRRFTYGDLVTTSPSSR